MKTRVLRTLGLVLTCGIATFALASCGKKKTTKETTTAKNVTRHIDPSTPTKDGYNILWSDEFSESKLNTSIWYREPRPAGWTNQELQRYTVEEQNGFVRDGKFVIKGIESSSEYTSCKLRNQDSHAFKYGRVEVSAKVPEGKGLWPAIWMMPLEEGKYGQWPKCGEIDIMEVLGDNVAKAYGTLHWGEPHAEKQGTVTLSSGTFASDFHTYAIEWEPGRIEWFIDGQSYLVVQDWFTGTSGAEAYPYPAPFDQDFCVQINLAIGGTWPGNPEKGAEYMANAEFEIDYVRVYQKTEGYNEDVKRPEKEYRQPDTTGNYITNAIVESETEVGWIFHLEEDGAGAVEAIENGFKVTTTANGAKDYSVQLFHTQMPVEKGKTYKISFDIKTDAGETRQIKEICMDGRDAGYTRYWTKALTVTDEVQHVEEQFTMSAASSNGSGLEFNLGNVESTSTIYITNIKVVEVK